MLNNYRQPTTALVVIENDTPLADSRQIALGIDVNHSDFFSNLITKYQDEVESDFGVIRFENGKPLQGSLGGRPEKYALLTEGQSYVYMAYSKNTEKARAFKRMLVRAFLEAKKAVDQLPQPLELLQIKDTITSLEEEVNNLKDSVEMLQGTNRPTISDPIEQAIYTTLASRNEPITASELKWRCPETRELTSKYITKVCKRMARAKIIKRLAPVGTQYVPRFFV